MTFNDTNGQGLIQECERITGLGPTGISGSTNLLKDFTARINNALDRFYAVVFQYDEQWVFDDRNYSESGSGLPIATTNLISGQQDYLFDEELLMVNQVFVKDSNGVYKEIVPQDDRSEPRVYDLTSGSGVPTKYELVANSILLDPIPNYNSTNGLKVVFKRNGRKFSYTDGSLSIGIPSLFHPYLAREASLSYLIEKNKQSKVDVTNQIVRDEEAIKRFISTRAKPKRTRLSVTKENNK